jgi:hypothetical protein
VSPFLHVPVLLVILSVLPLPFFLLPLSALLLLMFSVLSLLPLPQHRYHH